MNCAEAVCEPAVEDATGVIVKFKERYEAEQVNSVFLDFALVSELIVVLATVDRGTAWTVDGNVVYSC